MVESLEEKINSHKIFVEKPENKRQLKYISTGEPYLTISYHL
jgi:hypothetical protein